MKLLNEKAQKNLKSVIRKLPAIEMNVINILKLAVRDESQIITTDATRYNKPYTIPTELSALKPISNPTQNLKPALSSTVNQGYIINNRGVVNRIKALAISTYVARKIKSAYKLLIVVFGRS